LLKVTEAKDGSGNWPMSSFSKTIRRHQPFFEKKLKHFLGIMGF
jgi:hypothetical protein